MNLDRITTAPCIVQPPPGPDARCNDSSFALAHLACSSALILKPAIGILCVEDSINFSLFELVNGVETELTTGVSFSSSDPTVLLLGVVSGSGTAIAAGAVIVTAAYGERTVSASFTIQPSATCCNDISVATAIVVDHSKSMGLGFGGPYPTRLNFAKAVAASYGGVIAEVGGVLKDTVSVWQLSETVVQLLAQSQDTAAILAAIAGIAQTQNKTDFLSVFTTAATGLLALGVDRPVLLLVSDCEQSVVADRQAILDAAFAFKAAGGIVIVIAPRASGVLQGFDLAERVATGGFFINASNATAAAVLLQLNYLKKLLCAGSCVDPGDHYANVPTLNYTEFTNWELVHGVANLLGPGLNDFLPGNGLYVELSGQSHTVIGTTDSFPIVTGKTYRVSFKAAGNQQSLTASQSISVSIRTGAVYDFDTNTTIFQQTIFPAWNADFSTYNFSFVAPYDVEVRIYFEQNYAGTIVPGTLLDSVLFRDETDGTTLLSDDFDGENLTYIPPACGPSSVVAAIDDPEAPTVDWLGDYSDNLTLYHKFTYGVSWVTNEGETAVSTFVTFARTASEAHEQTLRRINLPQPVPASVVSIRIWRDLGGEIGVDPDGTVLYLLAEIPATNLTYLDNESIGAFQARYEPSVTAPTENTTGATEGVHGYGYAPCCYYYTTPGEAAGPIIPTMTNETTPEGYLASMGAGAPTSSDDYHCAFDQTPCRVTFSAVDGVPDADQWVQIQLPTPQTARSYSITTVQSPPVQLGPAGWILQGSNNGSDWTLLDTQNGISGWVDDGQYGEPKSFNISSPASFDYYRITITKVADSGIQCVISEIQLFSGTEEVVGGFVNNCPECLSEVPGLQSPDSPGWADIETGTLPPTGGFTAYKCASCGSGLTNLGTILFSVTSTPPAGVSLAFTLPVTGAVSVYEMKTLDAAHSPRDFEFQGSANNSTWVTLDSRADKSWFAGETKRYAVAVPAGYRYYRLVVSEVAVPAFDPLLTQVVLYGAGAATACATGASTAIEGQGVADSRATVAAQALLNCVAFYSESRSAQTTPCSTYQYGGTPITVSVTKTSLNSREEAAAEAQSAAQILADANRNCTQSNNRQQILIQDTEDSNFKPALPYPSVLFISGVPATTTKVVVAIHGLSHGSPDDIRMVLMSPIGVKVELMRNCGGVTAVGGGLQSGGVCPGIELVFDQTGSALPDSGGFAAGTYRPTQFGSALDLPLPAPQTPYLTTLDAFNGADPNGSWSLWVVDDLGIFGGLVCAGWDLIITP